MATTASTPKPISLSELDAVLEQAHVEGWRELAIIGPQPAPLWADTVAEAHTFYLREPLDTRVSMLARLSGLISLDLRANQIGDKEVHVLTRLSRVTSLNLRDNQIGDEGARALATLSGLTSLAVWNNQIGDEGRVRWPRSAG